MKCSLFETLSVKKFLIVEFMLLLPTGVFALILWYFGFLLLSLVVYMLVCLLLMPLLYMKFVEGITSKVSINIAASLANIYFGLKKQLLYGAMAVFFSGFVMFTILWICTHKIPIWQLDHVIMIWHPNVEIIVLSILLLTLHPILEELFWRLFVQVFILGGMTYDYPSELVCFFIAFHYGAMYIFIFANFTTKFYYAIFCAIPFILIGRKFTHYRHKGVLTVIIGHFGLNLGFVIFLNLFYWTKGWGLYQHVLTE